MAKFYNTEEIVNTTIGDWLILETVRKNNHIYYLCRCKCNKEKIVRRTHLLSGNSKSCTRCAGKGFAFKHSRWKGCGELTGRHWREIIWNATKRGNRKFEFTISIEYAWALFTEQKGYCILTGLPIRFKANYKDLEPQTASLDRIDSRQGYIENNVQWIHKDVNKMKNNFTEDRFIEICRLVARTNEK